MEKVEKLPIDKKFGIIYADPPWKYDGKFAGAAVNHYKLMELQDICKLPVKNIADKNCALLLWTTGPKLPDALKVCNSWEFKYKTVFIVWNKLYKRTQQPICGVGWYSRPSCEFLLVAVKSKLKELKNGNATIKQLLESTRQEHSTKPNEVRDLISEFFKSELNKIELFARTTVDR
jgi:N6-adenosine-specific RNA methylase IME4